MNIEEKQKVERLDNGITPGRRILPQFIAKRRFEVGKIKIGGKSKETYKGRDGRDYRRPVKYPYFAITTNERDETTESFKPDTEVYKAIGTDKPTEIPIFFYDNEPWMTQFAFYTARGKYCAGDGEVAMRLIDGEYVPIRCTNLNCEHYESKLCRKWGVLVCGILNVSRGIGSTYVFRTKGSRTITAINNVLNDFLRLTHGNIAGIPFKLKFYHQTAEDKEGKKHKIPVISLEYAGDIEDLRKRVLEIRGAEKDFDSQFREADGPSRPALAGGKVAKAVVIEEAGMGSPDAKDHYEEFRGEDDPPIPAEIEGQFDKVGEGKSQDEIVEEIQDELSGDEGRTEREDRSEIDEELGVGRTVKSNPTPGPTPGRSPGSKKKKPAPISGFDKPKDDEEFV